MCMFCAGDALWVAREMADSSSSSSIKLKEVIDMLLFVSLTNLTYATSHGHTQTQSEYYVTSYGR